ncbi:hypothetical protein TWF730_006701 [Orbilia blumenaviensis]|uniref:Uncharacterized protein n=1 Tax=Orbilia blumenaviensis TaxID=1796055 RepID=A0AAV9VIH6_9PEZI
MNSHPPQGQTHTRPHNNRGRNRGGGRNRGDRGGRGAPHPRPGPSAYTATSHGSNVPRHSSVHTNTPVSIILKEDQPTGRQVTGIVADVLTRGDHHRGVKVRLKDGRVGRVQKVLGELPVGNMGMNQVGGGGAQFDGTAMEGSSGSQGANSGDRGGGGGGWRARGDNRDRYRGGRGRGRGGFRPYDISSARGEDGNERAEGTYDLTAFIRGGRGGRGGFRGNRGFRHGRPGFSDVEGQVEFGEELSLSPLGSEEFLANVPKDDPIARCPVCGDFEGDETTVSHHVETHFR